MKDFPELEQVNQELYESLTKLQYVVRIMYDPKKSIGLEGRGNYSTINVNGTERPIYTKGTGDKKTILELNGQNPTIDNVFPTTSDSNPNSFIRDEYNRAKGMLGEYNAELEMKVGMNIFVECLKEAMFQNPNLTIEEIFSNFCIPISSMTDSGLSKLINQKLQESQNYFVNKPDSLEKQKSDRVDNLKPILYAYSSPSNIRINSLESIENYSISQYVLENSKNIEGLKRLGLLLSNYVVPQTGDFMHSENVHPQNIYWVEDPKLYGCYLADQEDIFNVSSFETKEHYEQVLSETFYWMWWCPQEKSQSQELFFDLDNLLHIYEGSLERILPEQKHKIMINIQEMISQCKLNITNGGNTQEEIIKFKNAVVIIVTKYYADKTWAKREKFSKNVQRREEIIDTKQAKGLKKYTDSQKLEIGGITNQSKEIYKTMKQDSLS